MCLKSGGFPETTCVIQLFLSHSFHLSLYLSPCDFEAPSHSDSGLGHVICFGQREVIKYDVGNVLAWLDFISLLHVCYLAEGSQQSSPHLPTLRPFHINQFTRLSGPDQDQHNWLSNQLRWLSNKPRFLDTLKFGLLESNIVAIGKWYTTHSRVLKIGFPEYSKGLWKCPERGEYKGVVQAPNLVLAGIALLFCSHIEVLCRVSYDKTIPCLISLECLGQ